MQKLKTIIKEQDIGFMSKDDYLNKFNTIVNDKTEFKLVKKDKRKTLYMP